MRAASRVPLPVTGIRLSLWRAVAAFRVAGLIVCLVLIVRWQPIYERPGVALAAGGVLTVVTGVVVTLAWTGRAHRWGVVLPDVVITALLTLASIAAQTDTQREGGMVTLTTIWAAGPAIEAAFLAGPVAGAVAGLVQYGAAYATRGGYNGETLYSGIVLVVTGAVVGLVARYTVRAEDELRVVAAAQAALAERERLARSIHDGVLQVLGLVARTGRDDDGRWGTIAAAAAEQEAALRGLITSRPPAPTSAATVGVTAAGPARRDLADALRALRSGRVTVSTPGEAVPLDAARAAEIVAAVGAALHNVEQHAGPDARAWVLLETVDGEVRVTVRDDGAGIAAGRLDEARADGRLGVAASIRGRIDHLGGRCVITSETGQGTEIEMAVPL